MLKVLPYKSEGGRERERERECTRARASESTCCDPWVLVGDQVKRHKPGPGPPGLEEERSV